MESLLKNTPVGTMPPLRCLRWPPALTQQLLLVKTQETECHQSTRPEHIPPSLRICEFTFTIIWRLNMISIKIFGLRLESWQTSHNIALPASPHCALSLPSAYVHCSSLQPAAVMSPHQASRKGCCWLCCGGCSGISC